MNIMTTIEEQLNSCKNLLSIFQNERQMYQDKKHISMNEVMEIVEKKKGLMDVFEKHHRLLRELKSRDDSTTSQEQADEKNMIRELASLLEQLLVIDNENEKLLRQILSTRQANASAPSQNRATTVNSRQRPSLQCQLPFIPQKSSPVVAKSATAQPRATRNPKLKQYAEINQLLKLNSNYA
jgi:hypothetical protein